MVKSVKDLVDSIGEKKATIVFAHTDSGEHTENIIALPRQQMIRREKKMYHFKKAKDRILDLKAFLPSIGEEPLAVFNEKLHNRLEDIDAISRTCTPEQQEMLKKLCFDACADALSQSRLNRHYRQKPFDYPGDFLGIEWLYVKKTDSPGNGLLWDLIVQHHTLGGRAVRHRKEYFGNFLVETCYEREGKFATLDIGAGGCRDIAEGIARCGKNATDSLFHCVDIDSRAIAYAKEMLQEHIPDVHFIFENANVFRIRPSRQYHVVWGGGGIFDYLSNRLAIALIKRMWKWTLSGGKMIVGNFMPNRGRLYLDWLLDWPLIYRTEADLQRLFTAAGLPQDAVRFETEDLGIYLFGIVEKAA